jgi:glycosyltransferase involved in cell wall biosynthesis
LLEANSETDYVLMTAARNEESYIEWPIKSVLAQTILPRKWVIVSDGSTDRTDELASCYARRHPFMEVVRLGDRDAKPDFSSKVRAIKVAHRRLQGSSYSYLGNLDADVSFGPTYFEGLISRFHMAPKLGICGGFISEKVDGSFKSRPTNTVMSVAGAVQFFRRECYERIGGHTSVRCGGEDWILEVRARMLGWVVQAFPDMEVFHHKSGRLRRGVIKERFREGVMDYAVGSHPLFEVLKCLGRMRQNPVVFGGLLRMMGFAWSSTRREQRPVSREFVKFLRKEQTGMLRSLVLPAEPMKGVDHI